MWSGVHSTAQAVHCVASCVHGAAEARVGRAVVDVDGDLLAVAPEDLHPVDLAAGREVLGDRPEDQHAVQRVRPAVRPDAGLPPAVPLAGVPAHRAGRAVGGRGDRRDAVGHGDRLRGAHALLVVADLGAVGMPVGRKAGVEVGRAGGRAPAEARGGGGRAVSPGRRPGRADVRAAAAAGPRRRRAARRERDAARGARRAGARRNASAPPTSSSTLVVVLSCRHFSGIRCRGATAATLSDVPRKDCRCARPRPRRRPRPRPAPRGRLVPPHVDLHCRRRDPAGPRPSATAVLYLLDDVSRWHRVRSTELWCWHRGSAVGLRHGGTGEVPARRRSPVGRRALRSSSCPAGRWQTARLLGPDPALVTCVVSPGFDFADFELLPPDRELRVASPRPRRVPVRPGEFARPRVPASRAFQRVARARAAARPARC